MKKVITEASKFSQKPIDKKPIKRSEDLERSSNVTFEGPEPKANNNDKVPLGDSLEAPAVNVKKVPAGSFEESTESKYVYGLIGTIDKSKEGETYAKVQFAVFNLNYDFESESFVDFGKISPNFLQVPAEREIYKFCKKIMICSKMEKEIPIIALLYIEKLMLKTQLLMTQINWRRFTFIALVIASKVFI